MTKPVLLVEDFKEDADAVQLALKKAGVGNAVFVVTTGEQAIAYLAGHGIYSDRRFFPLPGVLLLDLKLPGLDGFGVLEWLQDKPEFRELLVVVLSGHQGLREVNRAYELGANSFLFKPCNPVDIENLMKAFREYWRYAPPLRPRSAELLA
jgi:CheY-like chemotaxis protein